MTPKQLTLFPERCECVDLALAKISAGKIQPPNFTKFVRELGVHMTTGQPGKVIVVGVPNAVATKEVCSSLADFFEEAKLHGFGSGNADLATVEIPHALNLKVQHRQIAGVYTALPDSCVGHLHEPQFMLDFASGYARPNPMQQICGLITGRPANHYLVHNAHYLTPLGGSINDGINQVRFFIQLAAQSKKTHVLFTNASTACDWLSSGEITNDVTAMWLKPYNRRDKAAFAEFKGILMGYQGVLPLEEDGVLVKHAKEICDAVWGCTYRLKKWVINTLVSVRTRGGQQVTWDDFCQSPPSPKETAHAKEEFLAINAIKSPLVSLGTKPEETVAKKRFGQTCLPGHRKLGRDPCGRQVTAA